MSKFSLSSKKSDSDYLFVRKSMGRISGQLRIIRYRDKDTRQIVIYSPSLDISGYGSDENKAHEMFKFSLNEFFKYLIALPLRTIETELTSMGFKHHNLRNKEYSKSFIDANGKLQDFNAVGDEVEELTLEAA